MSKLSLSTFLPTLDYLFAQPQRKKYQALAVEEYPFDLQLLTQSRLYRMSRQAYLHLGGQFCARVCSTRRALETQDLFAQRIEYSPLQSELRWFKDHSHQVADPIGHLQSLLMLNEVSLFHEQNHRVLWRLLPPAPHEPADFRRYLNLAESLVVLLDLALGDELGIKLSSRLEKCGTIYRPAGTQAHLRKKPARYRDYLLSLFYVTYLHLEQKHPGDILGALKIRFPELKAIHLQVLKRGRDINESFTQVTNPQWQKLYWKQARQKLARLHRDSEEEAFYPVEDPSEFGEELNLAHRVLDAFGAAPSKS